jgi:polysaccharide export outer membrane protein
MGAAVPTHCQRAQQQQAIVRLTEPVAWSQRAAAKLLGTAAAWLIATGCASNPHGQLAAFLKAHEQSVSTGQYVVQPPDIITIHAAVAPEIDGAIRRVRPDGKISLRLLGEVDVAGLTTEQIAAKLRELLSRYYVDPEVVVDVSRYASQHYYVFGHVLRPGPKPYTGRDTLVSALAEAEPTFLAWRSQIRLVRPDPQTGQPKTIIVDLDELVRSGDPGKNVLLQPGDILEVPPTPLAWLGLRVRELLYPVEPVVDVYTRPAEAVDAHHVYEDEWDDGDGNRPRRVFRR